MAECDPEAVKTLYSRRDDVTLANPSVMPFLGGQTWQRRWITWRHVRDGEVTEFKNVARYESTDLAALLESEHWRTSVGGDELSEFDLRVSSTYRNEDGECKLVIGTRLSSRPSTPLAPCAATRDVPIRTMFPEGACR